MRNEPWQTWFVKLLCFFLCPFMAFLYSLKDIYSKSSYAIFFLFGVVFCWHMNSTGQGQYDDYIGIADRFVLNNETSIQYLREQLCAYFSFSEFAPKELYDIVLMWCVHQFSDNPHLYFAVASIPFLYFLLKSLSFITRREDFRLNIYTFIIIILFLLPRDIITVQNPRYSTATWMYVYAILGFYFSDRLRIKYILLIAATPLIHAAFWVNVFIFFACIPLCKWFRWAFLVYCISIPFALPFARFFTFIDISFLPDSIERSVSNHITQDSIERKSSGVGQSGFYWVGQTFLYYRYFMYILLAIIIAKTIKKNEAKEGDKQIFVFYLWFFALCNFVQTLPVICERLFFVVRILGAILWYTFAYPRYNFFLLFLLSSCSMEILIRYFYNGAVYRVVPLDIFFCGFLKLILDYI